MGHDAEKFLLGAHGSSDLVATNEVGDPDTFEPGLAVRRASTGALSLTSGELIGISLGKSLSFEEKTLVARSGDLIAIQITDEEDPEADPPVEEPFGYVVIGQPVEVSATTGKAVSDDVLTGAIYRSGPIKGINPENGEEIDIALVEMGGGL